MEFTHENNTRVGTKRYMSPEVLDFRYVFFKIVFDHCTLLVLIDFCPSEFRVNY